MRRLQTAGRRPVVGLTIMIISDLQVVMIILPDEVCPVLAGGGVTRLGEAAAHPEPLGAASV